MGKNKKRLGTKAQIRAIKERERRLSSMAMLAIVLAALLLTSSLIYTYLNPVQQQTLEKSFGLKAALVDQLSLTFPNKTFVNLATNIVRQANYTVDYYAGENVTVELYANLAKLGYKLIIFRVHSSATGIDSTTDSVVLFTSEPVSETAHIREQLMEQLVAVAYSNDDMVKKREFFGITPKFVSQLMNGQLQNCTIIMMGCEGLGNTQMAEAFVEKGAKAYIGWNDTVSAARTDAATYYLLLQLFREGVTIKQAVYATATRFGTDDFQFDNRLDFFPHSAGREVVLEEG